MSAIQKLQELHALCVRLLRNYIEEAKRSCQLLNEVPEFPVSLEVRKKILEQRRAENAAYERYQIARRNLFKAAQWD